MTATSFLATMGVVLVIGAFLEARTGKALSRSLFAPWVYRECDAAMFWTAVTCHGAVGVFMVIGAIYRRAKGMP